MQTFRSSAASTTSSYSPPVRRCARRPPPPHRGHIRACGLRAWPTLRVLPGCTELRHGLAELRMERRPVRLLVGAPRRPGARSQRSATSRERPGPPRTAAQGRRSSSSGGRRAARPVAGRLPARTRARPRGPVDRVLLVPGRVVDPLGDLLDLQPPAHTEVGRRHRRCPAPLEPLGSCAPQLQRFSGDLGHACRAHRALQRSTTSKGDAMSFAGTPATVAARDDAQLRGVRPAPWKRRTPVVCALCADEAWECLLHHRDQFVEDGLRVHVARDGVPGHRPHHLQASGAGADSATERPHAQEDGSSSVRSRAWIAAQQRRQRFDGVLCRHRQPGRVVRDRAGGGVGHGRCARTRRRRTDSATLPGPSLVPLRGASASRHNHPARYVSSASSCFLVRVDRVTAGRGAQRRVVGFQPPPSPLRHRRPAARRVREPSPPVRAMRTLPGRAGGGPGGAGAAVPTAAGVLVVLLDLGPGPGEFIKRRAVRVRHGLHDARCYR